MHATNPTPTGYPHPASSSATGAPSGGSGGGSGTVPPSPLHASTGQGFSSSPSPWNTNMTDSNTRILMNGGFSYTSGPWNTGMAMSRNMNPIPTLTPSSTSLPAGNRMKSSNTSSTPSPMHASLVFHQDLTHGIDPRNGPSHGSLYAAPLPNDHPTSTPSVGVTTWMPPRPRSDGEREGEDQGTWVGAAPGTATSYPVLLPMSTTGGGGGGGDAPSSLLATETTPYLDGLPSEYSSSTYNASSNMRWRMREGEQRRSGGGDGGEAATGPSPFSSPTSHPHPTAFSLSSSPLSSTLSSPSFATPNARTGSTNTAAFSPIRGGGGGRGGDGEEGGARGDERLYSSPIGPCTEIPLQFSLHGYSGLPEAPHDEPRDGGERTEIYGNRTRGNNEKQRGEREREVDHDEEEELNVDELLHMIPRPGLSRLREGLLASSTPTTTSARTTTNTTFTNTACPTVSSSTVSSVSRNTSRGSTATTSLTPTGRMPSDSLSRHMRGDVSDRNIASLPPRSTTMDSPQRSTLAPRERGEEIEEHGEREGGGYRFFSEPEDLHRGREGFLRWSFDEASPHSTGPRSPPVEEIEGEP